MAIREALNKHPAIAAASLVLALAVGVTYAISQLRAGPNTRAFYTDDDGQTFFSDAGNKLVPYQRAGKEVDLAEVFRTKAKGPYVIYMQRLDRRALALVHKIYPNAQPGDVLPDFHIGGMPLQMEIKKPGDTKWHDIEMDGRAMAAYISLNSDDGSPLEEVDP